MPASKVPKTLKETCTRDPIAAEYTANPDVKVEIIARDVTSDLFDVIRGRHSLNGHHLSSTEALIIETFCREEANEVGPKLVEELSRIWVDEDTIIEQDNGGRQNILVGKVAIRDPACRDDMSSQERPS